MQMCTRPPPSWGDARLRPTARPQMRAVRTLAQPAATDAPRLHLPSSVFRFSSCCYDGSFRRRQEPFRRKPIQTSTTTHTQSARLSTGETLNGQRLIEFRLGQEGDQGEGLTVASAELMVRAETAPRARHLRYTLWAFTVRANGSVGELAGATRRDPARGWQRLDVTRAARRWAAGGAAGTTRPALRLLLDCSGCAGRVRLRLGGAAAARPLLRLRLGPPPARRRRALDCDAAARGRCCRQTYYVSFRALGWDDWIVAPEGYYANYCRGACAPLLSYHSQVVEAARLERAACCAPVRFSALSLIYFGADSNIIKRDLPEMVVEECGCP